MNASVTAKTARELYDCDATMRAFVAEWDRERRCNIIFVEYLTDQELYGPAACALWAATERDRPVCDPAEYLGERGGVCGPYPTLNNLKKNQPREWFWSGFGNAYAHETRIGFYTGDAENSHRTAIKAILWLPDKWPKPNA